MVDAEKLQLMADKLRIHSIRSTTAAGSGHPTSCMSCAEIMSALFFSEMKESDEFILSKGHAAPILWAAYAEAGIIPRKELLNLRKISSVLEGHPTSRMKMVKVATGSLGQGLSAGVGMALAKKMDRSKGRVYVLLGDSEIAEGAVWEAANIAAYYNLGNLCAIADINRLGQSGETMHGHKIAAYRKKFEAFGWRTVVVNGHKIENLLKALNSARKSSRPVIILAKTIKGKGVSFTEDKEGWHGKPLDSGQMKQALNELETKEVDNIRLKSSVKYRKTECKVRDFRLNRYNIGDKVATRNAFGNALINLGEKNRDAVVIDGEVKNSTMTEAFFNRFPKRSIQSFIAEQNMTGMAMGIAAMGYPVFLSTFAAFLTRAHDFIRMASYSGSNLKIAGSHVGVSIGEDGPSQMGLEDLSMFLSIPNSIILYPCDAVSAEYCVKEMAKAKGISYLRTTREKTPVIYKSNERFPIGRFKVLRKSDKDMALVISAGVTVHEALKAYDILKKKRKYIRVIDLYSIRPVDRRAILKNAEECNNNVIVAEDHYFGGIGSVITDIVGRITHLYIKDIPRSGNPEQLRKKYGIDAASIVRAARKMRK